WGRYMPVTLAPRKSTGLGFLFHTGHRGFGQAGGVGVDIFPPGQFTAPHVALLVIILTAGTATIMWMGELVTQRGIGNGMSVLIFTSVISRLPQQGTAILQQAGSAKFYTILAIAIANTL